MKKVVKENPIAHFRKANEARQKTVKASMKKMQSGGSPFQEYMKTPGAVASDTTMSSIPARYNSGFPDYTPNAGGPGFKPSLPKAKDTKNQKALEKAWEKTYGQDYGESYRIVNPDRLKNTTMDKEQRRIGSQYKKGGVIKSKMTKGKNAK